MDISSLYDDKPTVYEKSQKSLRSELNLTDLPPTDVSTTSTTDYIQCFSLLSLKEKHNPIEFRWIFDGYGSLAESLLHLGVRILKADGTKCEAADIVAPCNLFFHALFENLQLYLNGTLVLDTSNYYPWIAYVQRLLGTSQIDKDSYLKDEFYFPNLTPNVFKTSDDAGFAARYTKTQNSKQFFLLGSLLGNFFNQTKYIPSGTECRIVLRRNNPYLYLNCATNTKEGFAGPPYRAEITEAIFYAAKKNVSKEVINLHRQQLSHNNNFKYPTNEIQVKAVSVAKGLTSVSLDGALIGKLPKTISVMAVETEAFNGNMTKSPFMFEDMGISSLNVSWNGEQLENRTVNYNFKGDDDTTSDDFLLALRTLKNSVGNDYLWNGINSENYMKGNVITTVQLLPNTKNSLSINRKGNVKVDIKFKKPITKAITVLFYCVYQAVFEIDRNKQIIFDQ